MTPRGIARKVQALRKREPWPQFGPFLIGASSKELARISYNAALDDVLDLLRSIDTQSSRPSAKVKP